MLALCFYSDQAGGLVLGEYPKDLQLSNIILYNNYYKSVICQDEGIHPLNAIKEFERISKAWKAKVAELLLQGLIINKTFILFTI